MYTHAYIIYIFILHLYSSVDGNLGCLQILHIVNNAHSRLLSCLSSEKMSASTGLCVLKLSINLVWGVIIISQATIAATLFVLKKKKKSNRRKRERSGEKALTCGERMRKEKRKIRGCEPH